MTLGFEVEGEEFRWQDVVSRSISCSGSLYSSYLSSAQNEEFQLMLLLAGNSGPSGGKG